MHYKKLDALRGISILLVICGHWMALHTLRLAHIGVEIFFVLSGFLITLILLRNKHLDHSVPEQKVGTVLKKFYIRRFLRIFPVYYLVLVLCYLFSFPNDTIQSHFTWDILYLNNVYAWYYNLKVPNFIHLWSLSVEEQFYLIWPWLILLTPFRYLKHILLSTVAIGIGFRFFYFSPLSGLSVSHPIGLVLLPSCLDLFACGGLLAYFHQYLPDKVKALSNKTWVLFFAGIAVMALCILLGEEHILFYTFFRVGSSMATVSVIVACLYTSTSITDFVFNNRVLIFLGKISYGVYLYHLLIPDTAFVNLYSMLAGTEPRFALKLIARFSLLIFISSASWYLFERPINNLKDKLAAY